MSAFRAPVVLFLKATTTKTITVPGYHRADGTFVPPHQKLVHYDPSKSSADVLAGGGSHSQKVALKKLSKLPHWHTLSDDEKHAHVLSVATNHQKKQSAAAAVSGWKAAMVAGAKPTASQQAAFDALDPAKKDALLAEVGAVTVSTAGEAKPDGGAETGADAGVAPVVDPAQQSGAQAAEHGDSATAPAAGVSSWAHLSPHKGAGYDIVKDEAEQWLAANTGEEADLSSTLVDLGYLEVAKDMGIYTPPSSSIQPSTKNLLDGAAAAGDWSFLESELKHGGYKQSVKDYITELLKQKPGDVAEPPEPSDPAEMAAAADKINDLLAGNGGHYPVKAAKQLAKDGTLYQQPTNVAALALIVETAKQMQAAASASAAVSGWKKAAHSGKNPTPAQWKAFKTQPADKKAGMLSEVHAVVGSTAHLKDPGNAVDAVTLTPTQKDALVTAIKVNGGTMPGAGTGVGYYAALWDSLSTAQQAEIQDEADKKPAPAPATASTAGAHSLDEGVAIKQEGFVPVINDPAVYSSAPNKHPPDAHYDAAYAAGYSMAGVKSAAGDMVYVFKKDGQVLTQAGMEALLGGGGADDGPKDGDTKTGANGQQLVFKNGRWHKVVAADEHGEVPPVLVPVDDELTAGSKSIVDQVAATGNTFVMQQIIDSTDPATAAYAAQKLAEMQSGASASPSPSDGQAPDVAGSAGLGDAGGDQGAQTGPDVAGQPADWDVFHNTEPGHNKLGIRFP